MFYGSSLHKVSYFVVILGQTLTLVENPVNEYGDVRGICSNPTGTSGLNVAVNGVVNGGGILSTIVITRGRQTDFVLPNVTRGANGLMLTCVQGELVFGNVKLVVNCESWHALLFKQAQVIRVQKINLQYSFCLTSTAS